MTRSELSYQATLASKAQIKQAVDLLLAGASSDPAGVAEFTSSWWKRTIFKRSAGPRAFSQQMDTFVVGHSGGILGYLAIQYGSGAAGAFEWGVSRPITQEPRTDGEQILRALVRAALDHVEENDTVTHFYVGMLATETAPAAILQEEGFYLADYQLAQMTGMLPLAKGGASAKVPDLSLSPKVARTFRADMDRLLRLDYPIPQDPQDPQDPQGPQDNNSEEAQDAADTAAALHMTIVGNPRLVQIALPNADGDSEAVGFIQINRYKDEQRVLYALAPHLWGTDTEINILRTVLAPPLVKPGRLRLRTFSWEHLAASRPALEAAFDLTWAESMWHRYVVAWEE